MASQAALPNVPITRASSIRARLCGGLGAAGRRCTALVKPEFFRRPSAWKAAVRRLEDDVDALVESRRPAGKKPVMPAGSAPATPTHVGTRNGIEDCVATAQVATPADSGAVDAGKPASDLVPTTLRIMGNVVYLHAPTGKLLMDIGNLSAPGRGAKLDLSALAATGDEAEESADFGASARRKQKGKYHGRKAGGI